MFLLNDFVCRNIMYLTLLCVHLQFFSNNPLARGLPSVDHIDLWFHGESLFMVIYSWWDFTWTWNDRKAECMWEGNPGFRRASWLKPSVAAPLWFTHLWKVGERPFHDGAYGCPFPGALWLSICSSLCPHSYVKREPHSAQEFLSQFWSTGGSYSSHF